MISKGWAWQTTKLLALALAVASSYIISAHAIAEDDVIEEDKRIWSVQENIVLNGYTYYKVHGNTIWGHTFGFMKPTGSCNTDKLYMHWSTYNEGIADIEGQDISITFITANETFDMDIPLVAVIKPDMLTAKIAVFSDIRATKHFFESLKNQRELGITINAPHKNPAYFDIPEDRFHLDNLKATQLTAAELCLDAVNSPDGMYQLAKMLYTGDGVYKDEDKGLIWLKRAASEGNTNAEALLARLHERAKNYTSAINLYRLAAGKNHPFSQFRLGYMLRKGLGIEQDNEQAFTHLLDAANNGVEEASYFIASMYLTGTGTSKDLKAALYWAEIAAKDGDTKPKHLLANILYKAPEPLRDVKRAHKLFKEAARGGDASSMVVVANIARNDDRLSDETNWLLKAATLGHSGAIRRLVAYYIEGQLSREALSPIWGEVIKAIKNNQISLKKSSWSTDELYLTTPADYINAAERLSRAAITGIPEAQFVYAKWLRDGMLIGGESYVEAISWMKVSETNGYKPSQQSINLIKRSALRPVIDAGERLAALCIKSDYEKCNLSDLIEELN